MYLYRRLWNPYVLSKAAGTLNGHTATIVKLRINHEEGHIISLSEDKMIKIWNARNLQCLQTVVDRIAHRPENIISSIFYDMYNRQLVTGSEKLETWPVHFLFLSRILISLISFVVVYKFKKIDCKNL